MPIIRRSSLILPRLPPQMTAKLLACSSAALKRQKHCLWQASAAMAAMVSSKVWLKSPSRRPGANSASSRWWAVAKIVGELALIDHQPRSASAIAIHDSTLQYVSRQSFADCAKDYAQIYRWLTAILAGWLRETDEALEAASFLSGRGCVARTLLELADCSASASAGAIRRGTRERQRCLERFEETHARHALLEFLHTQRYRST
jgi:hypothetical protein